MRYPIEFGLARSVDTETPAGVNAQKPLIQAEIVRPEHPVFYGYENKIFPIKFGQGSQVLPRRHRRPGRTCSRSTSAATRRC